MIYWVDAQLPPQLAYWLCWIFKVEAYSLRDLNLRDAEDKVIFQQARQPNLVLISKDSEPPRIFRRPVKESHAAWADGLSC